MKKISFLVSVLMIQCIWASAQKVGVNTITPLSTFHVNLGDSLSNGILFTGLEPAGGTFPSLGAGHRFMFYPGKGAIRAGFVDGIQWDNNYVGSFSVAFGYGTIAKGSGSCAIGDANFAGGTTSSAFGNSTRAKGYSSFVVGLYNDPVIIGADENVPTPNTPLFIVGNGDGNDTRHNAIVVRKDGHVGIGTNAPENELSVEGNANISGSTGIGTIIPNASAQLDVSSTSKGFLPPRMTFAQRDAIPNPVAGLVIWCSDCDELQIYNGTIWKSLSGRIASPPSPPNITICNNDWTHNNLNVSVYQNGDPIPKVTSNPEWAALTTGAYCYFLNDSATYAATYGKLYNWYAVNDPRGLVPIGWHIASHSDWAGLSDCLGGYAVSGGKLKEAGTSHWLTPNTAAINSRGFTALPGSYRGISGLWGSIGSSGAWWTSTLYAVNPDYAYYSGLLYNEGSLDNSISDKNYGFSVRCVRD